MFYLAGHLPFSQISVVITTCDLLYYKYKVQSLFSWTHAMNIDLSSDDQTASHVKTRFFFI